MAADIRFGTDGWRAIIAEDYTFENVGRCAQGLAKHLYNRGVAERGLIVGYDTRFLSRQFAEVVASVCSGNGIRVFLAEKPAPTPVISFSVLDKQAAGAAIITASHNPAIWNGFKFKPEYAGSATQEITDRLEAEIRDADGVASMPLALAREQSLVVDFDPSTPYLERISELVDLDRIKGAGLRVLVDAMYGAGGGYLPALFSGGKTTVYELHGLPNPSFPGMEQPEPIAHNLRELIDLTKAEGASVGLALDGDADRLGVVDETGKFISTLEVFSLLALYLLDHKGHRGPLVKGVTSSIMLNKLGQQFGVDVHEMRVGFKYIGPKMMEVDALIGGEESGGFAFRGHIPERDGILSGLFLLEYMAQTGGTPSQLVETLFQRVGTHHYSRKDVAFDPQDRARIEERLKSQELTHLAGIAVNSFDEIDGRRFIFDDGWLASRFSGTEPLLRIYAEANRPETVTALLDAAVEYLGV
jgi:phosphomannomutase